MDDRRRSGILGDQGKIMIYAYIKARQSAPLNKKLEGEQTLWNSNMDNQRIDWFELRAFCLYAGIE
jgi:hypothetical protein